VVTPYPGAQALKPAPGAENIPVSSIAFSWTPFKGVTEYELVLAKDPALTDVIVRESLPTTAYRYGGRLDYNTSYFWQVAAKKPVPSEPSPVFSFTTTASPPLSPAAPYDKILLWLQISTIINVFGFIAIAATLILLRKRRT
jgi:hypothetical protein